MPEIVALVPLRGGSKSLPLKNIKPIAGKPLCYWVIEELLKVSSLAGVYVSTDSRAIWDTVAALAAPRLHLVKRPAKYATDTASTESVMLHLAETVSFDYILTAQATSPLTTAADFQRAIESVLAEGYDSLVTGVRVKRFFWSLRGTPLNYDPRRRPRRQEFDGSLMENGAFYITKRSILLESQCRLGGRIGLLEMDKDTAAELDEPEDWSTVEHMLRKRVGAEALSRVKLLAVDVDGTLTESGMFYDKSGEAFKRFNTRDGHGLTAVRRIGIEVAIISGEESPIVLRRAEKLGINRCLLGVRQKIEILRGLCTELGLTLGEVAYIGDDIGDLECLAAAGFSACPLDATAEVRDRSIYVCTRKGGEGAVREVCDLLLNARA